MADTVLTLLEPGEYVLNRNAVDSVGKEKLDELNYEKSPRFPKGSIMSDYISNKSNKGIPAMSTGGITYGGYLSEQPKLDDVYADFGVMPKTSERFTEYDPSREGIYKQDYANAMDKYRIGAQDVLGDAYEKTNYQGGFGGSGKSEEIKKSATKSILDDYLSSQKSAYSTMFKGVRSEREQFLRETGQQLQTLEEMEGTKDYTPASEDKSFVPTDNPNWNPPTPQNEGDSYSFDGKTYYWDGNNWITEDVSNSRSSQTDMDYGGS